MQPPEFAPLAVDGVSVDELAEAGHTGACDPNEALISLEIEPFLVVANVDDESGVAPGSTKADALCVE